MQEDLITNVVYGLAKQENVVSINEKEDTILIDNSGRFDSETIIES